jgi:hypothetical protein
MTTMVPFTSNFTDMSTREGYQFEFFCQRCGNGYRSKFRHSVMGFGGRLANLGGGILGGGFGGRVSQVGSDAEWMRDGVRGTTDDKHLAAAVEDVKEFFIQCHRCGQWVCRQVCFNVERGLCTNCAPKLEHEVAALQAGAQIQQLNEKIQGVDWTGDVNFRDQGTSLCPKCEKPSGGGKFCESCGAPLAAAPEATKKFCKECGTELGGKKFCGECGTPAP